MALSLGYDRLIAQVRPAVRRDQDYLTGSDVGAQVASVGVEITRIDAVAQGDDVEDGDGADDQADDEDDGHVENSQKT